MSNIKIHFAAGENLILASLLKEAGINYTLGAVYSHIINQYQKSEKTFDKEVINYWKKNFKGTILDSGIFTLIYGGNKTNWEEDVWDKWLETLVQFIQETGYTGYPVEVDAQKIIGAEATWRLRHKMADALPNHEVITVWHPQDGQKGLDRLIEFSDYISFSVQELRKIKGIDHKQYATRMASYIKNKKPDIKIHLLACTEMQLIRDLNFCTSADSTSWLQVNKFGALKTIQQGEVKTIRKDEIIKSLPDYYERVSSTFKEMTGREITEKTLQNNAGYLLALEELLKIYSYFAGPQD
jgi:hypothetical protein